MILWFQITIEIEDINDESPKFIGDYSKPISLEENTDERRGLLFMEATDDDASRKDYFILIICHHPAAFTYSYIWNYSL
jgi:hypothetical protein